MGNQWRYVAMNAAELYMKHVAAAAVLHLAWVITVGTYRWRLFTPAAWPRQLTSHDIITSITSYHLLHASRKKWLTFFTARCIGNTFIARYYAVAGCPTVTRSYCVEAAKRMKPVLGTETTVLFACPTLLAYCRRIRLYPKIKILSLPSGTYPKLATLPIFCMFTSARWASKTLSS